MSALAAKSKVYLVTGDASDVFGEHEMAKQHVMYNNWFMHNY